MLKKEISVGMVFGLIMLFAVAAFAARLPTVNSDNNGWGDLLNEYLGVAHDSGGNVRTSHITSAMIVDATITAIDIANDAVNATALSGVSKLIFGHCTRDVPSFALGTFSNDSNGNVTANGNCTITGASDGDAVIVTPAYAPADVFKMHSNLTINGARIMGSNLTINFTLNTPASVIPQASHVRFNYIVFVNGTG